MQGKKNFLIKIFLNNLIKTNVLMEFNRYLIFFFLGGGGKTAFKGNIEVVSSENPLQN